MRPTTQRALVDAWHAYVDARFDFSAEGSRLEVKATTRDERVHQFNLRQLLPVPSATVRRGVGDDDRDRRGDVGRRARRAAGRTALDGDGARQMKVHQQVADTLGSDWARHLGRRFDEQQGRESLVFLDPETVPQVDEGPDEVREVRLTVDCTDVRPNRPSGRPGRVDTVGAQAGVSHGTGMVRARGGR